MLSVGGPMAYGSIGAIATIDPMNRLRLAPVTVIPWIRLSDLWAQSKKSKKGGTPAVPALPKPPGVRCRS
jgi:hypothetical protein